MKFLVQKSVVPNSLFFLEIFIRACINSFGFALVRFHGIFLYFAGTNICDDLFQINYFHHHFGENMDEFVAIPLAGFTFMPLVPSTFFEFW